MRPGEPDVISSQVKPSDLDIVISQVKLFDPYLVTNNDPIEAKWYEHSKISSDARFPDIVIRVSEAR